MTPSSAIPQLSGATSHRALVIRIGALGDVLLTRRFTYSLSLAGLRSTLLAPARHASLLRRDSWIDGILDSESPRFASAFAGTWPEDAGAFDAAFVISNATNLLRSCESAAAKVVAMPPDPIDDDLPISQQWTRAANGFCAPFDGRLPLLATQPTSALFKGATLIHPGSGSAKKNWPIERFVELGSILRPRGHRVMWVRGPAEMTVPFDTPDIDLLDRPSLDELAATLAEARLFVGNDSGVTHLAAAVGAPTLALFGPTNDQIWRPDGPHVETIRSPSGLLADIRVDDVLARIDSMTRL